MSTPAEGGTMTPEAQRIAIAGACGWKHINFVVYDDGPHGCPPYARIGEPGMEVLPLLPDYLNNLNAMHEAEKVLTPEQAEEYADIICGMVCGQKTDKASAFEIAHAIHATRAERAEAELAALKLKHNL